MLQLSVNRQEILLTLYDSRNGVSLELTKRDILKKCPELRFFSSLTAALKRMVDVGLVDEREKPHGSHTQNWYRLTMPALEMVEQYSETLEELRATRRRIQSAKGLIKFAPENPLPIDWSEFLERTRFTSRHDTRDQQVIW